VATENLPPPLARLDFTDKHIQWAEKLYNLLGFRGFIGYIGDDISLTSSTNQDFYFEYETVDADKDQLHQVVSNESVITIPDGVTRIRTDANVMIDTITVSTAQFQIFVEIDSGSGYTDPVPEVNNFFENYNTHSAHQSIPILNVTPGDKIKVRFKQFLTSTHVATIQGGVNTWFTLEYIK